MDSDARRPGIQEMPFALDDAVAVGSPVGESTELRCTVIDQEQAVGVAAGVGGEPRLCWRLGRGL